jgi:hypothetical protein
VSVLWAAVVRRLNKPSSFGVFESLGAEMLRGFLFVFMDALPFSGSVGKIGDDPCSAPG